jgi:hypothetical protein
VTQRSRFYKLTKYPAYGGVPVRNPSCGEAVQSVAPDTGRSPRPSGFKFAFRPRDGIPTGPSSPLSSTDSWLCGERAFLFAYPLLPLQIVAKAVAQDCPAWGWPLGTLGCRFLSGCMNPESQIPGQLPKPSQAPKASSMPEWAMIMSPGLDHTTPKTFSPASPLTEREERVPS